MQDSSTSQAIAEHQHEGKVVAHTLPVKKLFEQFESSEQGSPVKRQASDRRDTARTIQLV